MKLSIKNSLKLAEIEGVELVFERELLKVLENIRNLNTDPKKAREITIKFSFKSVDDKREVVLMGIQANSKLAPYEGVATNIYVDVDKEGDVLAAEIKVPEQVSLEDYEEDHGKVTNFNSYRNKFKTS